MAPFDDEVIESTRLTDFEGNLWPCFVFPDHSVPDRLIEPRPSKHALPVLILRRHEFVWRTREELTSFDPCEPREFGGERKQAFNEAVEYKNLDHYHNLVWNKQTAMDLASEDEPIVLDDSDDDSSVKPHKHASSRGHGYGNLTTTPITKKRPYSSVFKRPGPPTPSPTPIKKSKPSSKVGFSIPFGEDDDSDVDLPHPSTFTPTRKQASKSASKPTATPWKPSGKKFKYPDDPITRKQLRLLTPKGDGEPSEVKTIEPVNEYVFLSAAMTSVLT